MWRSFNSSQLVITAAIAILVYSVREVISENIISKQKNHSDCSSLLKCSVIRKQRRSYSPSQIQSINFRNDLALIELDGSVQLKVHVHLFCQKEGDNSLTRSLVSGWGLISYGMFHISVIVIR